MRIILKILAAPFVVALTVSWAFLVFVFCWAEMLLHYVSGLAGLIAVILFIIGQTTGGIVFAIIAFLISPVGIPAINLKNMRSIPKSEVRLCPLSSPRLSYSYPESSAPCQTIHLRLYGAYRPAFRFCHICNSLCTFCF